MRREITWADAKRRYPERTEHFIMSGWRAAKKRGSRLSLPTMRRYMDVLYAAGCCSPCLEIEIDGKWELLKLGHLRPTKH